MSVSKGRGGVRGARGPASAPVGRAGGRKPRGVSVELSDEDAKLRAFLDLTSDGVWEYDVKAKKEYHGPNWRRFFGHEKDDGQPLSAEAFKKLIHPGDLKRVETALKKFGKGSVVTTEFRLRKKDGSWAWVLSRGKTIEWDEKGRPLRIIGTDTDISGLKESERERKESSEKLKLALASASMAAWEYNFETREITLGGGWLPPKARGKKKTRSLDEFLSMVGAGDREGLRKAFLEFKGGRFHAEFALRRGRGRQIWTQWRGKVADRAADKTPLRMVGISIDITARREMEERLRSSEDNFSAIVENTGDLLASFDCDGALEFFNSSFAAAMREIFKKKMKAGAGISDLLPSGMSARDARERMRRGERQSFELRHDFGGRRGLRFFEMSLSPMRSRGGVVGFVMTGRDVTERKEADTLLRIQKEVGVSLMASGSIHELSLRILRTSLELEGIDCGAFYNYVEGEGKLRLVSHIGLGEGFVKKVREFDRESWQFKKARRGRPFLMGEPNFDRYEQGQAMRGEGIKCSAIFPVMYKGSLLAVAVFSSKTYSRPPKFSQGIIQTIASDLGVVFARAQAEEELKRSEQRYRAVVEGQTEMICRFTPQGRIIFANEAFARHFGLKRSVVASRNIQAYIYPQDLEKAKKKIMSLRHDSPVKVMESRAIKTGNKVFWTQWVVRAVFNDARKVSEYQLVGRDITKRKIADEALRSSEERLKFHVRKTPLAYIETTKAMRVTDWNPAAERIFGFHKSDILGKKFDEYIVPENYQSVFRKSWKQIIAMQRGKRITAENVDRTGRVLICEWHNTPLLSRDGEISGMASLVQDVTQRVWAENRMKNSEERLRMILNAASDGTWEYDVGGGLLKHDRRLRQELNIGENGTLKYDEYLERIHPEDRKRFRKSMEDHLSGRSEIFDCAYRFKSGDSYDKWLLGRAVAIRDITGKPTRLVGSTENVSERRRLDELKEQFEFRQKLLDAIPVPVYYKDKAGRLLGSNKAMAEIAGKDARSLTPEYFGGFMSRIDQGDEVGSTEKALLKSGGHCSIQKTAPEELGGQSLLIHQAALCNDKNIPEYLVGALVDITELKKTENALKEAERRLNTILNTMRQVIMLLDDRMRVVWTNKTARDVLERIGRCRAEGARCFELFHGGTQPCPDCSVIRAHLIPDYKPQICVFDEDLMFETYASPLRDKDGNCLGSVLVLVDVTEREKARMKSERQKEQLIQADKMASLGILVSGVAHEINNPTNFITINISLIRKLWDSLYPIVRGHEAANGGFVAAGIPSEKFASTVPELIAGIEEGTERISTIVENLKDFARQTPFDVSGTIIVNKAVERALNLVSPLINKTTKRFNLNYGSEIPECRGDTRRIEQVVINVVQNACHALQGGDKALFLSTYHDSENNFAVIEVADEGIGIPPENLRHVTDPFFTTKRDTGGTGLGLSISSSIVKDHKGVLEIDSEVDKGTTVRIKLPIGANPGSAGPV